MDRILASEAGDAGSIPAEGTINAYTKHCFFNPEMVKRIQFSQPGGARGSEAEED